MMTGLFFGLASATVWATTSLAAKGVSERTDPLSFNAFRMGLGSLLFISLLPFFGGWDALANLSDSSRAALAVSIISGAVIGDSLYFWSMLKIGAARAMPLSGIYPLFTWAFAVPMLGEQVTLQAIIGTLVVIAGLYLLTPAPEAQQTDARNNRLGVIAALVAAVLWAFATALMKIGLQDGVNVVAINSFRLPIGTLVLIFFILRWRDQNFWQQYNRKNLPTLIGVSLLSVGVGSILWILSIEYAGAARSSLINSMAPLIGAPLAVVFLRERMTWKIGAGTILAVLGVVLVV